MSYDYLKATLYPFYYPTGAPPDNPYRIEFEKGEWEKASPGNFWSPYSVFRNGTPLAPETILRWTDGHGEDEGKDEQ